MRRSSFEVMKCVVVLAMLMAASATGQTGSTGATVGIQINGSTDDGQVFAEGQPITIVCNMSATASSSGAAYNIAQLSGSVKPGWLGFAEYVLPTALYTEVVANSPAISTFPDTEVLNKSYTLLEGTYTVTASSNAIAFHSPTADPGDWVQWPTQDGGATTASLTLTFEVVKNPAVLVGDLSLLVERINTKYEIPNNSLEAKLNAAMKTLDDLNENNDVAAVNTLGVFQNAVDAQRNDPISDADADLLWNKAQQIIDLISGG